TYQKLEDEFAAKEIHLGDLKANIGEAIISLLEPMRAAFLANEEWQQGANRLSGSKRKGGQEEEAKHHYFHSDCTLQAYVSLRRRCTIHRHQEKARTPNPHPRQSMLIHLLVSLMVRQYRHDERVSCR
ncbi:hypothetical protein EV363DRAFT_1167097, partial [Boletus edulis]